MPFPPVLKYKSILFLRFILLYKKDSRILFSLLHRFLFLESMFFYKGNGLKIYKFGLSGYIAKSVWRYMPYPQLKVSTNNITINFNPIQGYTFIAK